MKLKLNSIFDKKTIKEYFLYSFFIMMLLNSILSWSYYQMGNQYSKNSIDMIQKTIEEFGEIDLQHICRLTSCSIIKSELPPFNGNNYEPNRNNLLVLTDKMIYNKSKIDFDLYSLTIDRTFIFREPIYKITLESDNHNFINTAINAYIIINFTFFIIFTVLFLNNRYREKRRQMLQMMGTEGSLREQNMRILTENIHHELNTPVAIIRGTLKKVELKLLERSKSRCSSGEKCISETIDFANLNYCLDQIDTVLQRMSNFKQIKYSNGNKTAIDVVNYSANSMNIYKRSNFKIDIDKNLGNYNLIGDLGNGDLMNVVSNHLRNSLEANATKIIIGSKFVENPKKLHQGKLHIFITDNGIGIRDRRTGLPLDKKNLGDVFKPYYSTKDNEGNSKKKAVNHEGFMKIFTICKSWFESEDENKEIRGVGLYLNKQMLLDNGGDLLLRETSEKGTVFEIIVPAKETDTLISQKLLFEKVLGHVE